MTPEQIKTKMLEKLSTMSLDEIADTMIKLMDKAIEAGMDAGIILQRETTLKNIKAWEHDQILKVFMK